MKSHSSCITSMLNDIQLNFLGRCWLILYYYSWLTLCHHVAFATCPIVKNNNNFCRFLEKTQYLVNLGSQFSKKIRLWWEVIALLNCGFIILFRCFHGMDNCFLRNMTIVCIGMFYIFFISCWCNMREAQGSRTLWQKIKRQLNLEGILDDEKHAELSQIFRNISIEGV